MAKPAAPESKHPQSMGEAKLTSPNLTGLWTPVKERTFEDLAVVQGCLPKELEGCFLRIGPNPQFPEKLNQKNYHFFFGEGMVHCVELKGGRASYRNRWVQTRKIRHDAATGGVDTKKTLVDARGQRDPGSGNANTAMVFHSGRLLCLEEATPGAWQLSLPELNTMGFYTFGGQLKHNFTAHPKVCGETGQLHFFGYGGSDISDAFVHYSIVERDGSLKLHGLPVQYRRPVMTHDMALTRNHAIFFDHPLWESFMNWDSVREENPTMFGIVPRSARNGGEVRWFEAPGQHSFHTANAWESEDGRRIELLACSSAGVREGRPHAGLSRLHRWSFDLASGKVLENKDLVDVWCEFPLVNPNHVGLPCRFVWMISLVPKAAAAADGVLKYDVTTGELTKHTFVGGRLGGESFFVPRVGATSEDDGFLLAFTTTPSTGLSDLYIVDAATMAPEPVAVVSVPALVPMGFHALWVPRSEYHERQRTDKLEVEPERSALGAPLARL